MVDKPQTLPRAKIGKRIGTHRWTSGAIARNKPGPVSVLGPKLLQPETVPMLIKPPSDIPASEITPKEIYLRRRDLLRMAAVAGVGAALGGMAPSRGIADG